MFDQAGRVLLQRRADGGIWNIPGGAMEPGESLEQTAQREVREETWLEIGALRLLCVLSGPQFFHVYPSGDAVYRVAAIYIAGQVRGTPRTNDAESTETRFVDLSETATELNVIHTQRVGTLSRRSGVPLSPGKVHTESTLRQ